MKQEIIIHYNDENNYATEKKGVVFEPIGLHQPLKQRIKNLEKDGWEVAQDIEGEGKWKRKMILTKSKGCEK